MLHPAAAEGFEEMHDRLYPHQGTLGELILGGKEVCWA